MTDQDKASIDWPYIEWLFLADSAQSASGKISALGIGWDRIQRNKDPEGKAVPSNFSVCTAINIPWSRANQKHPVSFFLQDADGKDLVAPIKGAVEIGRPAGIREGASQQFKLVGGFSAVFPSTGRYVVTVELDTVASGVHERLKRVPFEVVDAPVAAPHVP